MKYLISAIGFLLISCSAFADEIIMYCKHTAYTDNLTLQYKSGFFGNTVKRRIKGQWVKWCKYENMTLTVGDKGAYCSFPNGFTTDDYVWADSGKTSEHLGKTTYRGEWVADFLKVTFEENTTWERKGNKGQPIKSKRGFKCKLL